MIIDMATADYGDYVQFILEQMGGILALRGMNADELRDVVMDHIGFLEPTEHEVTHIIMALQDEMRTNAPPHAPKRGQNPMYRT